MNDYKSKQHSDFRRVRQYVCFHGRLPGQGNPCFNTAPLRKCPKCNHYYCWNHFNDHYKEHKEAAE